MRSSQAGTPEPSWPYYVYTLLSSCECPLLRVLHSMMHDAGLVVSANAGLTEVTQIQSMTS